MEMEEDLFREDKEFEAAVNKAPAVVEVKSFIKVPNDLLRNAIYEKWRGTPRASTAWMLLGYVIRSRINNPIGDKIYEEYYLKRHLLAARYTNQGLADLFGYKGRQRVNNHIIACEKEQIFRVEKMPWTSRGRTRNIYVYVFGSWKYAGDPADDHRVETIDMFSKFRKELAESKLAKLIRN